VLVTACASSPPTAHSTTPTASKAATSSPQPPSLAAFFSSVKGARYAAMFGPSAGLHDCRFVPGGPSGQAEQHGQCRTMLVDNGDGTGTITLTQGWNGGQHTWIFRLTTDGTVRPVSSTGDIPPQDYR
jgi:hypothetical protein